MVYSLFSEIKAIISQMRRKFVGKTGGYNQATRGQISSLEALQIIIPSAGTRVLQRLEKEYLSSTYFCLADDFISTVELLKDDFLVAMLSNDIPHWSSALLKRFDIEKYFDLIIVSGDGNQARKPEKDIYSYLLNKLKSKNMGVDQIYFVDDSLKNLKTVSLFNIQTIYKILKSSDPVDYIPDYKIKQLSEIPKILRGTNK